MLNKIIDEDSRASRHIVACDNMAVGGASWVDADHHHEGGLMARLWLDVEDLFNYAQSMSRPSGIQRLAFEVYATLQAIPDYTNFAHFVRHDQARGGFRVVDWDEIAALFSSLTEAADQAEVPTLESAGRETSRRGGVRLPPALRAALMDIWISQKAALFALARLGLVVVRGVTFRLTTLVNRAVREDSRPPEPPPPQQPGPDEPPDAFMLLSGPGDVILVLGSPWSHADYATRIAAERARGLKFALLVYDLIPIRRPEWCDRTLLPIFGDWLDSVFPLCDVILAISRATAADVEAYIAERGIVSPRTVTPIPVGVRVNAPQTPPTPAQLARIPAPGDYALIVSTIEARKNHLLLFRVWRRMLEEMPAEEVPALVFAGRVGWLVDDLMRQIDNTNGLNGKLIVIRDPTDAELDVLYRGCLFTLFPSFFEGWGLPVTESLALGKPCITSNRTSLPEAGGHLTRQFDPDNLHDAYAVIRATIKDRAGLARWEDQIRREFKPTPWSATLDAILTELGLREAGGDACRRSHQ